MNNKQPYLLVLYLILLTTFLGAAAYSKPKISLLDCQSDFEKYSTLCEKYWLHRISPLVQRSSNTMLQVKLKNNKSIILEDKEYCGCDCVWTQNYLAGYYPQIGYLFYETWISDWDLKTNSYAIPQKDFTTEHGSYFFIDANSGQRADAWFNASAISQNAKNIALTFIDKSQTLPSSINKITIYSLASSLPKEIWSMSTDSSENGFQNVHWINNSALSFNYGNDHQCSVESNLVKLINGKWQLLDQMSLRKK